MPDRIVHPIDPFLTPAGKCNLHRCLAIDCDRILRRDGVMAIRCERLGKTCDGMAIWAAYLNSGRECPLWPTGDRGSSPDPPG